MTAAAAAPPPTTEPSRAGRLLALVRKLIDYGKQLATTLRHHSATIDLAAATRPFGTRDIALILYPRRPARRDASNQRQGQTAPYRLERDKASLNLRAIPESGEVCLNLLAGLEASMHGTTLFKRSSR